jgi:hypothetical protein
MAFRSYREFYGRAGRPDSFGGDYSAFFASYTPPAAPNAVALLPSFGTAHDLAVLAYLGVDNAVYLAHRLALFTVPFGHPASINDGKVIAIRGEITEGGANYLHLANHFFESVVVLDVSAATDVMAVKPT